MTKTNFIFLSLFLLLASIYPLVFQLPTNSQNILAFALIVLLGIPHGAIDNLLFLEKSKTSTFSFFAFYIAAIFLNILAWLFFPVISFMVFLGISAYHFGQSQFVGFLKEKRAFLHVLSVTWGFAVIMGFVHFNLSELDAIIQQEAGFEGFALLVKPSAIAAIFAVFTGATLSLLALAYRQGLLSLEAAVVETLVLGLIFLTAHLFSFLIGFALFFTIIHSFKVLQTEFDHFYRKVNARTMLNFIRKLLPLTLVSFLGIGLIFTFIHFNWIELAYPLAMLMLISSITLPHVFVMEKFYGV